MWFGIITLFPEIFSALHSGITGRALKQELISLNFWNPRDFALDKHKSVDDKPYGGGPGMVMMVEPLMAAITAARKLSPKNTDVIYLTPQGQPFRQEQATRLLEKKSVIFLSGRYEGIDERVIDLCVTQEWSLGDFVLSGGELAAMAMIDATTRLIPGALGDAESASLDSLTSGLLKHPQYTRPAEFDNRLVPPVLLGGDHKKILRWRLKQSLGRTWLKKPELLEKRKLTLEEKQLLAEFIAEIEEVK